MTLTDWVRQFLESLEVERNLSQYTLRNYNHYLRRFSDWLKKNHHVDNPQEIDLEKVRQYRLYLARLADQEGGNLCVATQAYHLIALRSFLKWLVKRDVKSLAAERIDLPKPNSRSLVFLARDQVERLLAAPISSREIGLRDKAILELLFSTGLRVSELVSLNRDQVNWETREIGVVGKGRKVRVVFLSQRAANWVTRYINRRKDSWKPLFIRYSGKLPEVVDTEADQRMRFTARGVQRVVEKYRRQLALATPLTPHGLRHSFATDLLQAGAGLREIQEMLGHKNVATTQIYTHVTNPQLKRVHQKFHERAVGI